MGSTPRSKCNLVLISKGLNLKAFRISAPTSGSSFPSFNALCNLRSASAFLNILKSAPVPKMGASFKNLGPSHNLGFCLGPVDRPHKLGTVTTWLVFLGAKGSNMTCPSAAVRQSKEARSRNICKKRDKKKGRRRKKKTRTKTKTKQALPQP
jgi:hypothetical protein